MALVTADQPRTAPGLCQSCSHYELTRRNPARSTRVQHWCRLNLGWWEAHEYCSRYSATDPRPALAVSRRLREHMKDIPHG